MKRRLAVAVLAMIAFSTVFLLLVPHMPSALAQYSWTDNIKIYKDVTATYPNLRQITNNLTVTVDVKVYITTTEKANLLEYYKLSANGTDFIIIAQGNIILSNGTYYGLEPYQTLCFTVEAKGASSLADDDTVIVGVKVELWSAAYTHDIAVTNITLSKTLLGQGYSMSINITIENQGNFTETFNVTAYANTSVIATITNITLAEESSTTLIFMWNTVGFALGNYTINAYAWPVLGETGLDDNRLVDGEVMISKLGDLNLDGVINYKDASLLRQAYIGEYNYLADFNQDGVINYKDASLFRGYYISG